MERYLVGDISAMSAPDRVALLKSLGAAHYQRKRYGFMLAADIGVDPTTISRWHTGQTTVPVPILLLLQEWISPSRGVQTRTPAASS